MQNVNRSSQFTGLDLLCSMNLLIKELINQSINQLIHYLINLGPAQIIFVCPTGSASIKETQASKSAPFAQIRQAPIANFEARHAATAKSQLLNLNVVVQESKKASKVMKSSEQSLNAQSASRNASGLFSGMAAFLLQEESLSSQSATSMLTNMPNLPRSPKVLVGGLVTDRDHSALQYPKSNILFVFLFILDSFP